MTARRFVYRRLTTYAPLTSLIGGSSPRVWAKKTMTSAIEETPFIVYKMGVESNEDFAEGVNIYRQSFQVWIHDFSDGETADYARIDDVARQVKAAFSLANSIPDEVFATKYLESSQDFNDETLNTVFRYYRFQVFKKES